MKKRFPSCWRVLLISTDHQLTTLTFCRREQSGQIPFPSHIFNNQQDIFCFMIAYYHKCVTVCLTNQMSPFFMLCLCVVLGVFVPCDRTVLPVIAGFSCVFFLILFMVKAEVSVIVPRDWVCSLFVCLTVFVAMQPFVCFLCGCGHGFIQGCQQLCLFLLIAVGVFLAGVLEGVGGARLCREARCCLRLLRGRPNQLSSAHRQGPGVDTATAGGGGPRPPPPIVAVCHKLLVYIRVRGQILLV